MVRKIEVSSDQLWRVSVRALNILLSTAKKNAMDSPTIRLPVSASSGPNIRHSFGRRRSP
jgi:hypothetical protein